MITKYLLRRIEVCRRERKKKTTDEIKKELLDSFNTIYIYTTTTKKHNEYQR